MTPDHDDTETLDDSRLDEVRLADDITTVLPAASAPHPARRADARRDDITTVHPAVADNAELIAQRVALHGDASTGSATGRSFGSATGSFGSATGGVGSATEGDDVTTVLPETAPETVLDASAEIASAHRLAEATPREPLSSLDARGVSAWFGTHKVLEKVSLEMPAGQVTALIGPSGCGKSTFLRILNRMHELVPSAALAGEVLLDGTDIYDRGNKVQDARKHIGMVFQKPNPFPAMSIYDNVVAGLKLTGISIHRDERDELVERSLIGAGLWKEVKDRLKQPGGGLSGGQQQRLCIARSLAVKPKVLLMDEPCSALDPTSTRVIEETMGDLQKEVTIVIVTHNMQQAQRVSQQCAFFLASQGTPGAIVEHGDTEAMFSEPQDERTWDYVNGRFG